MITEPTRETENTSTIIDHIAVSDINNIVESGVVKAAISDHYVVYSVRKYQGGIKHNHKHIHTRQLKNFNKEAFLADLDDVNWSAILVCSDDINVIVDKFMRTLSLVIEKHAPSIEKRVSEKYSPWLSPDLKALFRTRDRIKNAAVKAKSEILMNAYRQVRNQANNMNSRLKREYFTNQLNECEGDLKRSYLTNRKQCCKVNGKISNIESITCGVPQGSCLGPLLFIIYINDLHLQMKHCDVNMYADDTSLMFASDSVTHINDCVNDDLNNLKSWLQGNKLSLNVAKTHSLVVGSRKRLKDINDDRVAKPSFVVGEANVSIVENIKYLGVIVDKHLSWDEQISAVTKKVSRGLGMLRFSKKYLPIVTVQKMYRSLVEPYFRYSCPVWGVAGINAINRLQKLQNRAARIVTNSAYDASALPIIKKLGWPTINELIESETLKMVYKSVNNQAPIYLTEMFVRLSDACKRELRNTKTDLAVPRRKSAFGQKCFSYKGAKLWNDLSVEVKSSKSYEIFKKRINNANTEC